MGEIIERWGALASAITAIAGVVGLLLIKPLQARARRKQKARAEETEFRRAVLAALDGINEDIGSLQYERLAQAHDFYVGRGWCPTSKKEQLCVMYRSYRARGRNHLSDTYEAALLALPEKPPVPPLRGAMRTAEE